MSNLGTRAWSAAPAPPVGVLDIGTSKIVCLIARIDRGAPEPGASAEAQSLPGIPYAHVLGVGHQRSRGVKAGVITDLDEAEAAVRLAVGQAERMAGVTLDAVYVAVSCGRLKSRLFSANADVESGVVGQGDIVRAMAGGRAFAERDGRTLVHLNRLGFRLERTIPVRDPRGMAARELSADLHAVTADEAPVRNLLMAVERCHLAVAGLIAAPYASALAASTADERRLGVTVIDLGAGSATMASFVDGQMVHTDAVPVGGNHLTYDIARALQTPLAEAERIKALYGTLIVAASDEHEAFSYPLAGEEDGATNRATRAQLRAVIQPRVAGTMALIEERLARADMASVAAGRIVLTGGASQLVGLGDAAAAVFGRPVRVAGVSQLAGLPAGVSRPAFAVAAGMLASAGTSSARTTAWRAQGESGNGYLGRVGNWLREGF